MSQKRVLVTGGTGFTGKYILRELQSHGYSCIDKTVDLKSSVLVHNLIREVRPNFVIHLAAQSFVAHANINEIYETNLLGTVNLLRALSSSELDVSKIIVASSANIYGNTQGRITENCIPCPNNHYSISKYAMEMAVGQWINDLPILICRPFNYTGVGQANHFLVPKIVNHYKQKKTVIELGNMDVYRDFSDVRDVARWYVKLLSCESKNKVVNLCSGKETSLRYIVEKLGELSGYEIEGKANPLYVRKKEILRLCGDNTLLESMVGVNDSFCVDETLEWMLST